MLLAPPGTPLPTAAGGTELWEGLRGSCAVPLQVAGAWAPHRAPGEGVGVGRSTPGCHPRVRRGGEGQWLLDVKRSPLTPKIHVLLLAPLRHLLPRATVLHIKAKLN